MNCLFGSILVTFLILKKLLILGSLANFRFTAAWIYILSSQGCGFSSSHVWMWELDHKEGWAPKNWCFWTVVLEKTLESPFDWRSNQSILKEISPECSMEGLMLKLRLQYYWPILQCWCKELTHWKRPWCWKRLKAGRAGDDRGLDSWMVSLTQWTWVWVDSGSWWWTGRPGMLQSMGLQSVRHDWVTELSMEILPEAQEVYWTMSGK